jgi:hypothetical protein
MKGRPTDPVRVSVMSGLEEGKPWTHIWVNGVDVTPHVRNLTAEIGVGALADVWLDLVGVNLDISAEVPRQHVQQLTLEEAEAHQTAQLTIDQQRGKRQYGRKGITPGVRVGISLGDRKQEPA